MRTTVVAASISLGLILVAVGKTPSRSASAADAGEAIETVQSHCRRSADPGTEQRVRVCAAIYRNASDRPVFDIRSNVLVGGQRAEVHSSLTFLDEVTDGIQGTRTALKAGESALLDLWIVVPEGVASDAVVKFAYRAAWTGDEDDLEAPKPELQYVDRVVDQDGWVFFVGEARNVEARTWLPADNDRDVSRTPVIALFRRGQLIGAGGGGRVRREPYERIGPDGRYIFVANEITQGAAREADEVRVYFRDAFEPAGSRFTNAQWQLTGLDHRSETGARGEQTMVFTVSMRNPAATWSHGAVGVFARRADFHVIGYGDCGGVKSLPAGGEATCSGEVDLIRPDALFDDIRFVTVEIGGAVAELPTPTPTVAATPCPALATPAPVPTLASVAGRVWLPLSIRSLPERCP